MSFDIALTQYLNALSGQNIILDWLMVAITQVGPYILVGAIAIRWFPRRKHSTERHLVIQCGLASALSLLLNQLILLGVHRVRPYDLGLTKLLIEKSHDPSFPSDHATLVFAIVTILLIRRDKWSVPTLILASMVCISRVFVGTHFASDVLGGAAIGIVGAFIANQLYRRLEVVTEKLVRVL